MVQDVFVSATPLTRFPQIKELESTMYWAIDNNDLISHLLTSHLVWINTFLVDYECMEQAES